MLQPPWLSGASLIESIPCWRVELWRWTSRRKARRFVAPCAAVFLALFLTHHWAHLLVDRVALQTIRSDCIPYEAKVPMDWRAVPPSPRSPDCNPSTGYEIFVVPNDGDQVVLAVQAEGASGPTDVSAVPSYKRTSRSGVPYTMQLQVSRYPTAELSQHGQIYTVRCQRGSTESCRQALTTLLDGSYFLKM